CDYADNIHPEASKDKGSTVNIGIIRTSE
ncbi:hypothetical protein ABIB15_001544, partial [Marisediminicola sp. UYEF4]